ncbi:MAG TPA: hypothetical protein VJN93_06310 [Candidatus Acidoferrum sp.]|nr:hypothetical protein [Candidatus Acidoferrum sp.]
MSRNRARTTAFTALAAFLMLASACPANSQTSKSRYPSMAPYEQYLMPDRDAEIQLARSAAPDSISRDAEVLVLGKHGYETAVRGKNGFVCLVERAWTAPSSDTGFWNPRSRGPICMNAPAARSYLPRTIKKAELVSAGITKEKLAEAIESALEKKELPAIEPGSMCYMLSKQGHLNDEAGHWLPHLMFFMPQTDSKAWGADLSGSPIFTIQAPEEHLTTFLVPVGRWSDGTPAASGDSH